MLRAATVFLIVVPSIVCAQIEGTDSSSRPSYLIEIERTPARNIWEALMRTPKQQADRDHPDFPRIMRRITGLEGEAAQVFSVIAANAAERVNEASRQGAERLCDERLAIQGRADYMARVQVYQELQESIRAEAVAQVRETLSSESMTALLRTFATEFSYSQPLFEPDPGQSISQIDGDIGEYLQRLCEAAPWRGEGE